MLLLPCFRFPFVFCFAATPFLERPGVVSLTRRVLLPTPRRSDSQGTAQFWAGAIGRPLFGDFDGIFCLPEGHRDPRTHSVQGPFCWGGGLFCASSGPFFHTARFLFPPQVLFFFGGGAFGARVTDSQTRVSH